MSDEVPVYVVCGAQAIPQGGAKAFRLQRVTGDGEARPYSIFIARTKADQYFGYVNLCPHEGAWLNIDKGEFFTEDRARLRCGRHNAEFEVETGRCVKGACKNEALEPIPVVLMDDDVCLCGVELSEELPDAFDEDEFEDTMEIMIHPG